MTGPPPGPQQKPARSLRIVAIGGLFLLLVTTACRVLLKDTWHGKTLEDQLLLLWTAATLGFNYPEFGFVKRGLGGTVVHLTGLSQLAGTVVFHVISAAALAGVACRFLFAMAGPLRARVPHLLVLLVLMLFWAEDPGRTDMAIAALVAFAAVAILRGRPVVAALILALALAMHEDGFIFGIPLVAMLLFEHRGPATLPRRSLVAGALVLLATTVFYLLMDRLPHADPGMMAALVQSRLPRHFLVDWAIYFAVAGTRGIRTAMCHNIAMGGMYLVHIASGSWRSSSSPSSWRHATTARGCARSRCRCRLTSSSALWRQTWHAGRRWPASTSGCQLRASLPAIEARGRNECQ